MAHYLICYDIANPRRLARVHRYVVKHAHFVQFSVYYFQGNRSDLDSLLDEVRDRIDENYDDVRAYVVEPLSKALQVGCPWLPDGIGLYE